MKRLIAVIYFFFVIFTVSGQTTFIYFSITDSATGDPLPFANAYLKLTGKGAVSSLKGIAKILPGFSFTADTLICSYIGYKTQRIPVDLTSNQEIKILMPPILILINEATVTYEKPLATIQILKNALRKTTANYSNTEVNLSGLYREIVKENDRYIQLNEAFVKFYYTSYPQNFDHTIWEDYILNDEYAFDCEGGLHPVIHHFNTKKDQVKILENRSTNNYTKYNVELPPIGGPLDLSALDLVKYQCDFLNSANFNKYAYILKDNELINSRKCYVIYFYPNDVDKKMVFDLGKKLNRSIYTGRLYIDVRSFAVVRIEYQLAKNINYGFYSSRIPLSYYVRINYQFKNGKWFIDEIKLNHIYSINIKNTNRNSKSEQVLYEYEQLLKISNIETDSVVQFSNGEILKHTWLSTIRYNEMPYNESFWEFYERNNYPILLNPIRRDLETIIPLDTQFALRFKQRLDLPIPKAMEMQFSFKYPSESIEDNYQWLADLRFENEILSYLSQENDFANNYIIPYKKYQKRFFTSMDNFFPKDTTIFNHAHKAGDVSFVDDSLDNNILFEYTDSLHRVPVLNFTRFESKRVNCFIIAWTIYKNYICITYTSNGGLDEYLVILKKGDETIVDSIAGASSYQWFNDSLLLYTKQNLSKRSDKLFLHPIGKANDSLLFFETDPTFDIFLAGSSNTITCKVESKAESEVYLIGKTTKRPILRLIRERRPLENYSVKEFNGMLYILTNEGAINNRIFTTSLNNPNRENWKEIVPSFKGVLLDDFIITEKYIILKTYKKSFVEVKYRLLSGGKWKIIQFDDKIFDIDFGATANDRVELHYSSPNNAECVYQFDLSSGIFLKKYQFKIKGDTYFLQNLKVERIWAKSMDGKKIPITIIKSSLPKVKHMGLILKVYGAYGDIMSEGFSSENAILANEGFTIAYAHVRGEKILGNQWYLDGKLDNKENSFNDYIACAEYLIKTKYTTSDWLVGYGNSAGGLVVGAAINKRPELFNTVILDHPYLDVLTTMMNDSLPLTTDEYKEWGNPNDKEVFNLIKSYSPYQNIKEQAYPNVVLIAGYNDYQTPYWQVAKYAARLRKCNTGNNSILFKTDFLSGHIGSTTGKEWLKELSFQYAFVYSNLFQPK